MSRKPSTPNAADGAGLAPTMRAIAAAAILTLALSAPQARAQSEGENAQPAAQSEQWRAPVNDLNRRVEEQGELQLSRLESVERRIEGVDRHIDQMLIIIGLGMVLLFFLLMNAWRAHQRLHSERLTTTVRDARQLMADVRAELERPQLSHLRAGRELRKMLRRRRDDEPLTATESRVLAECREDGDLPASLYLTARALLAEENKDWRSAAAWLDSLRASGMGDDADVLLHLAHVHRNLAADSRDKYDRKRHLELTEQYYARFAVVMRASESDRSLKLPPKPSIADLPRTPAIRESKPPAKPSAVAKPSPAPEKPPQAPQPIIVKHPAPLQKPASAPPAPLKAAPPKPKPQAQPQLQPQQKAAEVVKPKAEEKPQAQAQPQPIAKPQPTPTPTPTPSSSLALVTQHAQTNAQPQPQAQQKPEAKAETIAKPQPSPSPAPVLQQTPQTATPKAEVKPQAAAQPKPQPEPIVRPQQTIAKPPPTPTPTPPPPAQQQTKAQAAQQPPVSNAKPKPSPSPTPPPPPVVAPKQKPKRDWRPTMPKMPKVPKMPKLQPLGIKEKLQKLPAKTTIFAKQTATAAAGGYEMVMRAVRRENGNGQLPLLPTAPVSAVPAKAKGAEKLMWAEIREGDLKMEEATGAESLRARNRLIDEAITRYARAQSHKTNETLYHNWGLALLAKALHVPEKKRQPFFTSAADKFMAGNVVREHYFDFSLAALYAIMDNPGECRNWLQKSADAGTLDMESLRRAPDFDNVRKLPWFEEFTRE